MCLKCQESSNSQQSCRIEGGQGLVTNVRSLGANACSTSSYHAPCNLQFQGRCPERFLLPDGLEQAREVEAGGSHLLLHNLEASTLQRSLNVCLSMQVGTGRLQDRHIWIVSAIRWVPMT